MCRITSDGELRGRMDIIFENDGVGLVSKEWRVGNIWDSGNVVKQKFRRWRMGLNGC